MKEVAVMLGWVISFQTEIRDAFKMAGDRGFEPLLTDSESAVLPLD
jgi:hypothetical protein